MKYSVDYAIKFCEENPNPKFVLFWGHHPNADGSISHTCLSQWWECSFVSEGVKYRSAEQYMMSEKAKLFGDTHTMQKILDSYHPNQAKSLGRMVMNFNEEIWNKHKYDIVLKGNILKFSQNPNLKSYLLSTGNRILAEASPYDKIWGIGLDKHNVCALMPKFWKGQNLLGFALMETRDIITAIE